MSKPAFLRIAILPPELWASDASVLRAWVETAQGRGADAFYIRVPADWKVLPPTWGDTLRELTGPWILPARFQPLPGTVARQHREDEPLRKVSGYANGRSCHSLAALLAAEAEGFDYAFFSPVFSTSTHPDAAPLGLENLRTATQTLKIPVYALGGVDQGNAASCIGHGAHGIAAIGMFWY